MGKKVLIKKKGKEKKGVIEKDRNHDSQIKKSKFWLVRMREKQKRLFNYVRLVAKYAFFDAKFIFSHSLSHAD